MNDKLKNSQTIRNGKSFFPIALMLFIVGAVPLSAQASLSGEVTAFSGIFFQASGTAKAGDYFQPSTSLKLAPSYISGPLTIRAELTGSISLADSGGYDVAMKLGEAYATLDIADGLSVTAGSKIISWGTALASNPEGFINPVDSLSQLVSENRSDWLLPVMLVSGKYIKGPFSIEAVALPFFRPSTIPAKSSRWYPASLASLDALNGAFISPALFAVDTTPSDLSLNRENMQGAGRMSLSQGAVDFGLSGWYGFTKTPVFDVETTPGIITDVDITASYKRQGAIGADVSATVLDSSVAWMETALYLPEYYLGQDTSGLPVALEKNTLVSAFGLDRTFGIGSAGDLYCAMEGNLSWILAYDSRLASSANETEIGATLITEYRPS
ncbi:MAG: hypothetical protein LLF89_10620, partial [Spirochaetaceae bacterium]|nr:hypothetical protein [Spirochaetaceae bacterium]